MVSAALFDKVNLIAGDAVASMRSRFRASLCCSATTEPRIFAKAWLRSLHSHCIYSEVAPQHKGAPVGACRPLRRSRRSFPLARNPEMRACDDGVSFRSSA
jgi:hypothetical protein